MPLRFPNPGSDIDRLIHIFRLIYRGVKNRDSFDIDQISKILTLHLQASSRGAVGATALARSTGVDRSRDPLYNQSKSYSEVFRMLGWLRPTDQRLDFTATLFGDLIGEDLVGRDDLTSGLLRECLIGITFPNSSTNNVGVKNQRPFRWLLLLAAELDGVITRHEMIIGLLSVTDDLKSGEFQNAVDRVRRVRGTRSKLIAAIENQARISKIQMVTLENYTRFPVGVLKSLNIGWAVSERRIGIYERPTEALVLTPEGLRTAQLIRDAKDIREEDIADYALNERASFASYAYYSMLLRSGLTPNEVNDDLLTARLGCVQLLADLEISNDPHTFIYSPIQQANDEVLRKAQA